MADFASTARTEEGFDIETNARSQESMDRVHGSKPEKAAEPPAEAPAKPAGDPAEPKTATEPEKPAAKAPEPGQDDEEDEKLEPSARRAKVQERIDRITRERRAEQRRREQAERDRDEIRERAEAYQAQLKKLQEKFPEPKQDPDAEPDIADFEDIEDYKKAYRDHVIKQDAKDRETRSVQQSQQAAKRERMQAFQERIFAPAEADPSLYEGLPDILLQSLPLSALKGDEKVTFGNFLMEAMTRVKEPWVVLNHFKTPDGQDELQRLSTLHPLEVSMEIGMLYKGLSSANKTAPEERPKPEISKAKPPGKAISSGPPSDLDPYADGIDFDEAARREAALKRRR